VGAIHREVAGVVAQSVLLLVRRVVLLVDDHELKLRQRREHGEPRAEHELRGTRRRLSPGDQPLAGCDVAVEHYDPSSR
jgi:hypothetical protein